MKAPLSLLILLCALLAAPQSGLAQKTKPGTTQSPSKKPIPKPKPNGTQQSESTAKGTVPKASPPPAVPKPPKPDGAAQGKTVAAPKDPPKPSTAPPTGPKPPASVPDASAKPPVKPAPKPVLPPLSGIALGLDFLKNKNAASARQTFKASIKGASKADKKACRKLSRVAKQYEKVYFRTLRGVEQLKSASRYKAADSVMYGARAKFLNIKRRGMSDRLRATDAYLMQEHEKMVTKINKERVEVFTKKLDEARKLLVKNPQRAKQLIEEARKLMTIQEIGGERLNNFEKEADYQLYLSQGNEAASRGDYTGAMESYLKAQAKQNSPEVREKIAATRATLYAKYLKLGDNNLSAREYVAAAKFYIQAEAYTDDRSELNIRKPHVLEKLVEIGKDHAGLGKHKEAVEVFDLALKMGSSEEARRLREVSYNYVEYDYWMKKANDILQTGNTGDAETAVESALRYRKTDDATQLLQKIKAYHQYCKNAEAWLKNGNIVYAEAQVESARNEIPIGGWGIRLKAKISDYHAYIKSANDLLKPDTLAKAKEQITAAANICSTEEVKKLKVKAGM